MKQHVHDAGDGWFYDLGITFKLISCFLAVHLIVGSIFVEGLVRSTVTVMNTLVEASHYMLVMQRFLVVYDAWNIPLVTCIFLNTKKILVTSGISHGIPRESVA